jgi:3-deoxy-manno-octulosonate cytidylyltransferase (CMP-KDO synthetase)
VQQPAQCFTLQQARRTCAPRAQVLFSTACTPLGHDEVQMLQRVKCVTDCHGYALYFSRGAIPSNKDGEVRVLPTPFEAAPYLLHLGIVCLDAQFLQQYADMPATPLMLMEDLEQLKVLENGYKVKVVTVDHAAFGVDTPEDVPAIEARLRKVEAGGNGV